MKLIIKVLALTAVCGVSISAFAEKTIAVEASKVAAATSAPVVDAAQKQGQTVIVSPRTGMRYVVDNPKNIPIVFKTEVLAPATAANVSRIAATNPALSAESQQNAEKALLNLEATTAAPAGTAAAAETAPTATAAQ